LVAELDFDTAVEYYTREAGADIATRFIDALQEVYCEIGNRPATGSPRYAHELNLPGLRSQTLRHFPYIVFYMERDDQIDVWRILHAQQNIAAWLRDFGS